MKKSNFFFYRIKDRYAISFKKKKVKNSISLFLKGNTDLVKKQKIFCLLKRVLKKKKLFQSTKFKFLSLSKKKKLATKKKKNFLFKFTNSRVFNGNEKKKLVLKKKAKTKKFIKRPFLTFSNFNLFSLFNLFVYNNPKRFTLAQTKNFLIKKLKLFNFLKKKDFSIVNNVISCWYQTNFYSNLEYFYKINYKHPRYKRLNSRKSNKRLKFFHFFTKAKHSIS